MVLLTRNSWSALQQGYGATSQREGFTDSLWQGPWEGSNAIAQAIDCRYLGYVGFCTQLFYVRGLLCMFKWICHSLCGYHHWLASCYQPCNATINSLSQLGCLTHDSLCTSMWC